MQQRDDGGRREIDMRHLAAGLVQHMTERQRPELHLGKQTFPFVRRQGCEKMIVPWRIEIKHGASSVCTPVPAKFRGDTIHAINATRWRFPADYLVRRGLGERLYRGTW